MQFPSPVLGFLLPETRQIQGCRGPLQGDSHPCPCEGIWLCGWYVQHPTPHPQGINVWDLVEAWLEGMLKLKTPELLMRIIPHCLLVLSVQKNPNQPCDLHVTPEPNFTLLLFLKRKVIYLLHTCICNLVLPQSSISAFFYSSSPVKCFALPSLHDLNDRNLQVKANKQADPKDNRLISPLTEFLARERVSLNLAHEIFFKLCLSSLVHADEHKPIWMHAEEREEMSKVSSITVLKGAVAWQCACTDSRNWPCTHTYFVHPSYIGKKWQRPIE